MSHPPVVVVESGGVPRTQVAEGGSAPAFTVVESGARPITLADNSPPIALFNPDGTPYAGGGVPEFLVIDGVNARLLKGRDNQPLQGRDGQYLYGRAA